MAKIVELKQKDTNEVIYPKTITSNVYTESGTKLSTELENKANISDLSNVTAEQVINSPLKDEIEQLTREEIKKDLFIDMWNSACGTYGTYNKSTGFFELNGLTDITYEQAIPILLSGKIKNNANAYYRGCKTIRTALPFHEGLAIVADLTFYADYALELVTYNNILPGNNCFGFCTKLHTIKGGMSTEYCNNKTFSYCPALENVDLQIKNPKTTSNSLNFEYSPKINLESWKKLIANAANTSPITITVHPDVYAKLTGDTTNSAAAALSAEELAQWQQLLVDAANKNITFATV